MTELNMYIIVVRIVLGVVENPQEWKFLKYDRLAHERVDI